MKAISLFSGGLDSQLAVRLIQNQGIVVTGINFSSPFFGADKRTERAAHDL
ncbi:MAG TPA: tRNA 4-thiouridine(8) synthase ThiI, partial [Syntrophomonas sp.]|nr:tRNA 4-thiouridine(8) synthase ThiI [Syntrophomonas sp.]